ncbi:hypothetical protein WMY93_030536 [Mugilogobius chulae]|uniref:PiggyBac transposable element-derived protein domain-containing protein n=1 Tax=Mugilogobius chulae TaxID=88201 RepID=A0AAW0MFN7_9GOBI
MKVFQKIRMLKNMTLTPVQKVLNSDSCPQMKTVTAKRVGHWFCTSKHHPPPPPRHQKKKKKKELKKRKKLQSLFENYEGISTKTKLPMPGTSTELPEPARLLRRRTGDAPRASGPASYLLSRDAKVKWARVPHGEPVGTGHSSAATAAAVLSCPPPVPLEPPQGPTELAREGSRDILSTFLLFLTDDIQSIILRETNHQGLRKFGEDAWKRIDAVDLRAYVGLLLLSGVYRSRGEAAASLWDAQGGRSIFRATMSLKRFYAISSVIRFDDRETRAARRATDRLAAIREVWDSFVQRLPLLYTPGSDVTVDEQLVPFRGRCKFRVYLPNKPHRYGLKVWVAADARSSYALNMDIYTGAKEPSSRKAPETAAQQQQQQRGSGGAKKKLRKTKHTDRNNNDNNDDDDDDTTREADATGACPKYSQTTQLVLDLTRHIPRGWTITCDNFFTSMELAESLLKRRKLTLVGTVRKNRTFLPRCDCPRRGQRKPKKGHKLVSKPKLISQAASAAATAAAAAVPATQRRRAQRAPPPPLPPPPPPPPQIARGQEKPHIVSYYNHTKSGVDNLDQVVAAYSCRRMTARWPLVVFHNILDVSSYNAYVLYRELNSTWMPRRKNRRRVFLESLGKALVELLIQRRACLPRSTAAESLVRDFRARAFRANEQSRGRGGRGGGGRRAALAQQLDEEEEEEGEEEEAHREKKKRRRCKVCKKDRRTQTQCTACSKYICGYCTKRYCVDCSSRHSGAAAEEEDEDDESMDT